ncbi:MAG: hypothetical protein GX263_06195 [Firmicutes bacterium]|nr:hypothetical protein [Bacillota bacterium]
MFRLLLHELAAALTLVGAAAPCRLKRWQKGIPPDEIPPENLTVALTENMMLIL